MVRQTLRFGSIILLIITLTACDNDEPTADPTAGLDKLVLVTNITTANPVIGYVGTLKDLTVGDFTNAQSRQSTQYPFLSVYKNDVFVMPNKGGDVVKKYTRQEGGILSEAGSFTAPAGSTPIHMVVESDTKAFISLWTNGKIAVVNPTTMQLINYIDLTQFALGGDGNPDPSVMALKKGKLYVACTQTSDGYTSQHPVQVLIIDINNGNSIASVTDSRSFWAGSVDEPSSIFFDESGDMYIYCVASYGFGGPSQKSGFLRIKNGQTIFDETYFFNTTDYSITGIAGNKVDYLQHMKYAGNGIVYATGNVYALASNPPNYITDRTFGSFKVDLANKGIGKLDLPYSNGYAASVGIFDNKILFGIAGTSAVGIYTYDPITNTPSASPIVTTQGDPSAIEVFK
jgi:hypothetical protein